MASEARPSGYTAMQITLHWIIAALVVFQLILGEDVGPAYHAARRGTEASAAAVFNANLHVYAGLLVLVLALVRFAIRLRHGVPPAPPGESALQRRLATGTHVILYATIFAMPLTGAAAWYLGIGVLGELHALAKPVIIVAVALHAAGALWQHFVARTDVLVRMLRPGA